ncbi:MAG: phage tail protein [Oscillospiraceae bacterium]|jgi:phage tail-like protein|nr:phage tail protein [Oscillospiraceae bacterium]
MFDFIPASFFTVHFEGIGAGVSGEFTSVSGLDVEFEWETYSEGGTNYPRRFFKGVVPQTLVLEQGTLSGADAFAEWIMSVNLGITKRLNGTIELRAPSGEVKREWLVTDALPVKYIGPPLNAMKSELAVTRLEFIHNGCF